MLLLAVAQTWANRYSVWPDLMSYIEVGETSLEGRWGEALSGHWSPLYSWILGLFLALVRPSPEQELLSVKALQLLIFLFNVITFDALLRELPRIRGEHPPEARRPAAGLDEAVLVLAAYVSFAWASLRWLVVYRETPDLLVAGLVYGAAALTLRGIRTGTRRDAAMLGGVLGLGYLAKTVMFPLALPFLAARLLAERTRKGWARAGLALLVFACVSAPYAAAVSIKLGRPTIGEAGRLNYAWLIHPRAPSVHWQGEPRGSGQPVHPTHRISMQPDVYEFAAPISGTYPPWFNPVYWNEGLVPIIDLRRELGMVRANLGYCFELFGAPLLGLALVPIVLGGRFRTFVSALAARGPVLLPGVAGLVTFVIGTWLRVERPPWGPMQTRYLAPFVLLILVGAVCSVRVADSAFSRKTLNALVAAACLALTARLVWITAQDVAAARANPPVHVQWEVAQALNRLGVVPGSRVAVVAGDSFYWARLARVRIVAEARPREFWAADAADRERAMAAMERAGARVLVATPKRRGAWRPRRRSLAAMGWTRLAETEHFAASLEHQH